DINPHLLNFYEWLQRGLVISMDMVNDRDFYYRSRTQFNKLIKTQGAKSQAGAELFYYLNRTGYNGLCRFNRKGEFNVP
ncbi:MAG TPA: adenine methyltransferase, partial [Firmicutes bacterium]|nr:adenine methyltransferase [Bacillota bacterium]